MLVGTRALQDCYNLNDTTLKPADLYLMLQALNTVEEHCRRPTYTEHSPCSYILKYSPLEEYDIRILYHQIIT